MQLKTYGTLNFTSDPIGFWIQIGNKFSEFSISYDEENKKKTTKSLIEIGNFKFIEFC